jgi:hypothetical protein
MREDAMMRKPSISEDGTLEILDAASADETGVLQHAIDVFGAELASAIDEGRIVSGDLVYAKATTVADINGKSRKATLTFTLQDN